jgi:uncharacterized protein involved in outer membrane biogenesis
MKHIIRIFTIILVIAISAVLATGIWLHLKINSKGFLDDLQHSLSDTLNTTVHLGNLKFNLFSGFDLKDVKIDSPAPNNTDSFVNLSQLHLSYAPEALLKRTFLIRELKLTDPQVALRYYADGSNNLPKAKTSTTHAGFLLMDTNLLRLNVNLDRFTLQNGQFEVYNGDQDTFFAMNGIDLNGKYQLTPVGSDASGQIHVNQMKLGPKFTITAADSTISYKEKKLTLPNIVGKAYSGNITGLIEGDLGDKDPTFQIKLKLDNADIPTIVKDFKSNLDWLEGKLVVTANLSGQLRNPRQLTGDGEFEVKETSLAHFGSLVELANIFGLSDLPNTKFHHVKGTFKISDQKINFFNLEAIADEIQITSAGSLTFDRQADFDVMIALKDDLLSKVPPEVMSQLTQRDDGFHTLTFHLSGPLNDMKSNISEKLTTAAAGALIQKLENHLSPKTQNKINSVLDLFKKSSPSERPADVTPSPEQGQSTPAPSATPAPTSTPSPSDSPTPETSKQEDPVDVMPTP